MSLVLAVQRDITPYLIMVGIMMAVVIAGGLVLLVLRARVLRQTGTQQAGGLLDDLRRMLERGEISQAEFDATKATMVARLAGKAPPPRPAAPPGAVRTPDGGLVAKPGVDLTGAPLPGPSKGPGPRAG
jgi:hypothetical protein